MRLNPAQLGAALQRGLAPVYLVAGEEPLLVQEALDAIRTAARQRGFSEREVLDVERGFQWQRLADACNMPSLFAPQRIVEVRMSGAPDAAGAEALTAAARKPAADVLLIVTAGKLDGRARNGAWFAALEAAGASLYAWPIGLAELPGWIGARLLAAGVRADAEAVQLISDRTQGNVLAAQQEVAKLALLHPGAAIGVAEVSAAVADSAHFEVFGWFNSVLAGDLRATVRGYERLRGEGIDLLQILGGVTFALRQLARAAALFGRRPDAAAAVEAAGIVRQNQAAFARAVGRARYGRVLGWIHQCAAIDMLAKTTQGQAAAWEDLLSLVLAVAGAPTGRFARSGSRSRPA